MTLTQYASLGAKTTVILTEIATATTANEEIETVVAAIFAGGILCRLPVSLSTFDASLGPKLKIYIAQSGATGATLAIRPPSQPPGGSKEDGKTCPSNPKEEYKNCGGADAVGLCKSGTEVGCPCDEV
jgi:hypothetical protein